MIETDVFISGAGLAGSIAALSYAKAGRKVTVADPFIDSDNNQKDYRTTAYLQPSKLFLEELGVWEPIEDSAMPLEEMKIIDSSAIKNGEAPDGDQLALAGLRSKHNTYMSVPLIWTMINQHHAAGVLSGGNFGVTDGTNWVPLMVMVALGWHVVWQLYKKSAKVQGM